MIEIGAIASDSSNLTAGQILSNPNNSPLRADRGVVSSNDANVMSFGDFLDMINPLQHIPLISAVYRSVSGDTINPVSRIAGDALYGGILGVASAGVAAAGAIGDEVFSALNDGKTMSGTVVAALFGKDDSASAVQVATAAPANDSTPPVQAPKTQVAALQTPVPQQSILVQAPELTGTTPFASAPTAHTTAASTSLTAALSEATATTAAQGQGMPLDRSKMAYGGVMDPAMMQNALQNQSLALALASGQQNLQTQHTIRNNRFSTSTASPVTAPTAQSAGLPLPGESPILSGGGGNVSVPGQGQPPSQSAGIASAAPAASAIPATMAQSLPSSLRQSLPQASQELKAIKGIDQYRNTAQRVPVPFVGSSLDVTN